MSKTCPIPKFKVKQHPSGYAAAIEAIVDGEDAGVIQISKDSADAWTVSWIDVYSKRCGIGTKLYEQAVKFACNKGARLRSDTLRTLYSDRFWQKQIAKGRAFCLTPGNSRLFEAGAGDDEAISGRSGCQQYEIKAPCKATIDLSGQRRRRRRRR